MKVKTLIQQLKKLDQNATVVVQEYNGSEDIPRPVIFAQEMSSKYINGQRMRGESLKSRKFVLISGFNLGDEG